MFYFELPGHQISHEDWPLGDMMGIVNLTRVSIVVPGFVRAASRGGGGHEFDLRICIQFSVSLGPAS